MTDALQKHHSHSEHSHHLPVNRSLAIAGIFIGMLFSALDQTIVGTAMPTIIGKLGGFDLLVWATTAYMLTSTAIMPIVGKLADILGRRIMYLSGLIIFLSASILCGFSQTMVLLVIFRGLQGLGGGILMPMALVVIGDLFTGEQRAKMQGITGGIFGIASVIGPQVGGWLTTFDWRLVFYINIPFGILAAVLIGLGLSRRTDFHTNCKIDYAGAILAAASLVCLLLALTMGGKDFPWGSWQILTLFGGFIVFTGCFCRQETKAEEPILPLNLFKDRVFITISGVGLFMGMGMFGAIMFIPIFMQAIVGVNATQAGTTLTPMMLAMVASSVIGGRLVIKTGVRPILIIGMIIMAFSFYLMSTMGIQTNQFTAVLYMICAGLGMGFVMPNLALALQESFPIQQRGVVTSSSQFFRAIGATLGVTLLGALLNRQATPLLSESLLPQLQRFTRTPMLPPQALTGIKELMDAVKHDPLSLFQMLLNPDALKSIPKQMTDLLLPSLKIALASSLHYVFLGGMVFLTAGAIWAFFLGNVQIHRTKETQPVETEEGVA